MRRRVGEVKEERLGLVCSNELDRFAREFFRQQPVLVRLLEQLVAAPKFVGLVVAFVDVKRALKPLPMWPKRRAIAEVPFAGHCRLVSGGLEALRHRYRLGAQAVVG